MNISEIIKKREINNLNIKYYLVKKSRY